MVIPEIEDAEVAETAILEFPYMRGLPLKPFPGSFR